VSSRPAALFLKWLADYKQHGECLSKAALELEMIESNAQTLLLKTARAIKFGKTFANQPLLHTMEERWAAAMDYLLHADIAQPFA
jgi:hypothetical protein